jgi:hypothetical protein
MRYQPNKCSKVKCRDWLGFFIGFIVDTVDVVDVVDTVDVGDVGEWTGNSRIRAK